MVATGHAPEASAKEAGLRFHFGDPPPSADAPSEREGWRSVRAPRPSVGYPLAAILGVLLMMVLVAGLMLLALTGPAAEAPPPDPDLPTPWLVLIVSLLLFVPLHELLHLVWHPGGGRTPQSWVVVWPAKLRLGVYYEGCMSRRRWSVMRAAPFLVLSLTPAVILGLTQGMPIGLGASVALQLFMALNALGSGADALALILVLHQVPARAQLCFRGGSAYWRKP